MQLQTTEQGNAIMVETQAYNAGTVLPHLHTHPNYERGHKTASEYIQCGDCLTDRKNWLNLVDILIKELTNDYYNLNPYMVGYFNELTYYKQSVDTGMLYIPYA